LEPFARGGDLISLRFLSQDGIALATLGGNNGLATGVNNEDPTTRILPLGQQPMCRILHGLKTRFC
jgi:hypothetical protein